MPRGHNRILSAALLLPVILFLGSVGTSFGLWRCQSDGVARARCCCPAKAAGVSNATAPSFSTVSRQDCCAFEQHLVDRAPAGTARASTAADACAACAPVLAFPIAILSVPPDPSIRPARPPLARVGPQGGRALVVLKQSFLI
jgi:hypothetical protein